MIGYRISHAQDTNVNWFLFANKHCGFAYNLGRNIAHVLAQVRHEFKEIFGEELLAAHPTLSVIHTTDSPSTFRSQNIIFLSSNSEFYLQHIYQFAHELCHFMVPTEVCKSFRWFEETLCEAMSWYVLQKINDRRETSSCSELTSLYPTIDQYIRNSMNTRQNLNGVPVAEFIAANQEHFISNCYDRAANSAVAYEIYPLLLSNSELWRIVPLLHKAKDCKTFGENISTLTELADISSDTKTRLLQLLCV